MRRETPSTSPKGNWMPSASVPAGLLLSEFVERLPGWKKHHHRLFGGFSKVYVWGDGDKAGREFSQKVEHEIDMAIVIHLPDGVDVNSLLVAEGPDAIRRMVQ
jgi:hypothetical protein